MCVYIYIYIYIHTYMYTQYTYIYIYVYISIYVSGDGLGQLVRPRHLAREDAEVHRVAYYYLVIYNVTCNIIY